MITYISISSLTHHHLFLHQLTQSSILHYVQSQMAGQVMQQWKGWFKINRLFQEMHQQGKEMSRGETEEEELPKDYVNRKISQLSDLQLRYTYSNASSTSEFSMYEPTGEQFQAKFVKDEELYADLVEKVAYVRNIVNIESEDLCLYVLHNYQWNEEKLANFYFTEDWSTLPQAEIAYNQLLHQPPVTQGECPVCLDHARLFSTGLCPHAYCARCWVGYLRNQLLEGRIFPSCMHVPACPRAPALRGFVQMVTPELSELNRKKTCVSYALQNKDICYCPNEKCPYFCIKPNMMELSTVACPCGELYCYRCRREPHYPVVCEDVKRWYTIINSEEANSSWIRNNTRECPKCRQPIQKKVGCSHMKCICQCQFCYECNRTWDEAHAVRKTECPNRASLPRREKDQDRIVELDGYLNDMMQEAERNKTLLKQCEGLTLDQTLQGRVVQLKTEVISAWMTFKWTKIVLCLDGKPQIDAELQKECIQSIQSVMEPIEKIIKNAKNLASKELHIYGEQVLQRKQVLKKNIRTWLDAWEVAFST